MRRFCDLGLAACVVDRSVVPSATRGAILFRGTFTYFLTAKTVETETVRLNVLLPLYGGLSLVFLAQHQEVVSLTEGTAVALAVGFVLLFAREVTSSGFPRGRSSASGLGRGPVALNG